MGKNPHEATNVYADHVGDDVPALSRQRAYRSDLITVSEAYLAEHPADDGEPADREWLKSVGFDPEGEANGDLFSPYSESIMIPGDNEYCRRLVYKHQLKFLVIDEDARDGDEIQRIALPMSRSRGELRRLCTALGIPLKT